MKTIIFWFLLWTKQYDKGEQYAEQLVKRGYGLDSWRIRKVW